MENLVFDFSRSISCKGCALMLLQGIVARCIRQFFAENWGRKRMTPVLRYTHILLHKQHHLCLIEQELVTTMNYCRLCYTKGTCIYMIRRSHIQRYLVQPDIT